MPSRSQVVERMESELEHSLTKEPYQYAAEFPVTHAIELDEVRKKSKSKRAYLIAKRTMDVVCSMLGLIVLSPLFLLTAVAIKLDSKGPAFYSQIRIGKNSRPFTMFKFRSMCPNADTKLSELQKLNEREGPAFKMTNDPRVTKVGRFIRATCIDELPQLVNILKGDMSIVGPRPPLPNEVAEYTPYHMRRLTVTPGLTCYWQISNRNVSFSEWVASDLKYIHEQNLMTDIKIMLKTFWVIISKAGAK